ncbi:MAG TPA: glycoside hydrolase family 127 protein [Anaerohalosphaeraceae bacterium]|nr:glycoside hydrolase family 127 protein [Anaerohalosphaeraceae bacterium]
MIKNKCIILLVVTVTMMTRAEGLPQAQAFDLSRIRLLDGPFKQIQELHRTGLVRQLEPDKLLFPFRENAGIPQPSGVTSGYGGWDSQFIRGHYCGHYLSAAARMYAATGDVSFLEKANYIVTVLAECQEKLGKGYLSAFPAAQFDRLEATPRVASVEYYTIHKIMAGLVDAAHFCGNKQALDIAAGMSDYFAGRITILSPEQIEFMLRTDYTGNPVNEFGGMAEALSELYRLARNQGDPNSDRHLKLAAVFNRNWFIDPLIQGQDQLNGLHGNTHIAQAAGLARYALVCGDVRTARAAEAFWRLVVQKHSFVNGGNTFHEKLRAAGIEVTGAGDSTLSPLTAESCNTHNMLKLTRSLFERSPLSVYGDYYENALYNHILATIAPDHGKVMYYMPLRPGDFRVYIDEPFCCQGTGIENAARFGEAIYFHQDDTLWVNLFIASTLDWREQGMKLRLDTEYPEKGRIKLTMNMARPQYARLNFRIPSWMKGRAELKINDHIESVEVVPGTFLSLARTWKDGDVITLELPLALRSRPSMDDPSMLSLFYGPVLLAAKLGREGMPATDIGNHMAYSDASPWPVPLFESETIDNLVLEIKQNTDTPLLFTSRMINPVDLKPMSVELAPFYLVHHQRYAVYWKVLSREQLKKNRAESLSFRDIK